MKLIDREVKPNNEAIIADCKKEIEKLKEIITVSFKARDKEVLELMTESKNKSNTIRELSNETERLKVFEDYCEQYELKENSLRHAINFYAPKSCEPQELLSLADKILKWINNGE